jgi:hypothetical protein
MRDGPALPRSKTSPSRAAVSWSSRRSAKESARASSITCSATAVTSTFVSNADCTANERLDRERSGDVPRFTARRPSRRGAHSGGFLSGPAGGVAGSRADREGETGIIGVPSERRSEITTLPGVAFPDFLQSLAMSLTCAECWMSRPTFVTTRIVIERTVELLHAALAAREDRDVSALAVDPVVLIANARVEFPLMPFAIVIARWGSVITTKSSPPMCPMKSPSPRDVD